MSKVYIAKNAIGQFNAGEEVVGLEDAERIEYLLSIGAIEEAEAEAEAEDDTDNGDGGEVVQLDKLTKADLIDLLNEEGIEYDESNTKAELIALFPKD